MVLEEIIQACDAAATLRLVACAGGLGMILTYRAPLTFIRDRVWRSARAMSIGQMVKITEEAIGRRDIP